MTPLRRINRIINGLAVVDAVAAAIWGLALARALAESWPVSPTFNLVPTLAVMCGSVLLWVAWRWRFGLSVVGMGSGALLLSLAYLWWPGVAPQVGWTLLLGSMALAALLSLAERVDLDWSYERRVGLLLIGVTAGLYLRTLGPTVGQADTFEFQVVAPTLGVAHPTGYPLYIFSGKLFSLLPLGSVAWRVNLTSACFASATVWVLYQLVRRLITCSLIRIQHQALVALLAALALACSSVFWSQAVVAEVYALHNLFVAVILLLLVDVLARPSEPQKFYLLAFLLGLSFSNHLTTALLLPAVGLTVLLVRPRLGWRRPRVNVLVAAGCFLLGLLPYLYIYFRWPMLHDGVWMSWGEFWRYITGQQFGGALRLDAWYTDWTRYQIVGRLLREPFGWPGLAVGAVGLAWLAVKQWRVALVSAVTFVAYAWYALNYYVPDLAVFLLPAHLVLALWLGTGCLAVLDWGMGGSVALGDRWGDVSGMLFAQAASVFLLTLGALLPLGLLWTNLPRVDQSGEREQHLWGERVLALPLARDAAILADSVRIAPLYYLQRAEGHRPDLDLLVLADEATYRAELTARLAAGQTVYLARYLPGLEGLYHLRALGPLTEVGVAPLTAPPTLDQALHVRFVSGAGEVIELLGLTGPVHGPEGGTGVTLYWRAAAPVREGYAVRLRLVDSQGQVWWDTGAGGRHPVNNYYPTPAWRPGEVISDYHEVPPLALDPLTVADGYTLEVSLAPLFSQETLPTETGEQWVALLALAPRFATALPAGAQPFRVRFDDGPTLVGARWADIVPDGTPVEVTLYWRAHDLALDGEPMFVWRGVRGAESAAPVLAQWGRSRFLLQAPEAPGTYRLRLGWVDGDVSPVRCGWLARPGEACELATIRVVEATATALANFDGKMLLLDADIERVALRPGQDLALRLRWQGLQPMAQDYTVSVQLVGPDGVLRGQVDAWPVQGTWPTSQWTVEQTVDDPYRVTLAPDAPPGRYRVGVVVYLLATQTRLPLLDKMGTGMGQVIGDVAWVGDLVVSE